MYNVILYTSFLLLAIPNVSFASDCSIYTCSNVWDGQCGAFKKETDKWCTYDYEDEYDGRVCCADDFDDCCEDDPAAIGGTVGGVVVFLIFAFWYCKRRRDNTNEEPPNHCFKICCPPCAVLGYQGCESKTDGCMACCLCSFFTLCCWNPKQVIVENQDNVEVVNVNYQSKSQIVQNI